MDKICGIYKLSWSNNKYFYYGQSLYLYERKKSHILTLKKTIHFNRKIQNISNKYGLPLFEIIEICNPSELDAKEQEYIDKYFKDKYCCNLSPNSKTCKGVKWRDESKKKLSNSVKMTFINGRKPYIRTQKVRIAAANRIKGRTVTEETRKKIREKLIGQTFPAEINKKKGRSRYGSANVMFGKPSPLRKKIAQCDSDGNILIVYDSMKEASIKTGLSRGHIRIVCNQKYKTAGGLYFKYNDYLNDEYPKQINIDEINCSNKINPKKQGFINRKHNIESKKRISETLKKYYETNPCKNIGRTSPLRKKIIFIKNEKKYIFNSLTEFSKYIGYSIGYCSLLVNKKTKNLFYIKDFIHD